MNAPARPHLTALLFQDLRVLTGDVLANLRPATVRAGAREEGAAERRTLRAAGRNMLRVLVWTTDQCPDGQRDMLEPQLQEPKDLRWVNCEESSFKETIDLTITNCKVYHFFGVFMHHRIVWLGWSI